MANTNKKLKVIVYELNDKEKMVLGEKKARIHAKMIIDFLKESKYSDEEKLMIVNRIVELLK